MRQRRPRVDEVLEDIGRDDAVERSEAIEIGGLERSHDDVVVAGGCHCCGGGIELHSDEAGHAPCSELRRPSALSAADIEHRFHSVDE
jgi:hypothetical protein